ncbi:MAG: hypothetical protein ACI4W2_01315 [Eubacterium sp.]
MTDKLKQYCDANKVLVITGHYGSGKTEIAMNLAVDQARRESSRRVAIADLDIVNPYFRSRDYSSLYEKYGIRMMASSRSASDADLPTLPADIRAAFDQEDLFTVFDVGGDPAGAHVLRGYTRWLQNVPHAMLVVVNANRPQTDTAEKAAAYIAEIEKASGLKADGIIDNTHLCRETTAEELKKGRRLCAEISEHTGLDTVCHTEEKGKFDSDGEDVYPINIYLKKPWEV